MPKRSPWAVQPKKDRRKARQKFSTVAISKPAQTALAIRDRGIENVPFEEKASFLQRNRSISAKVFAGIAQCGTREAEKVIMGVRGKTAGETVGLSKMSQAGLDNLVQKTIHEIVQTERRAFTANLEVALQGFFKARKIPINREALNGTLYYMFSGEGRKISDMRHPLNLSDFEREYLDTRKSFRGSDQEKRAEVNDLSKKVIGKARLTPNQTRIIKKWLFAHREELEEARNHWFIECKKKQGGMENWARQKLDSPAWTEYHRGFQQIEEQFLERARQQALAPFLVQERPKQKPSTKKPAEPIRKAGTRAERMAEYIPHQKEKRVRTAEVKSQERQAKISGRLFDSTEYALTAMTTKNPQTGRIFRELAKKGQLKRGTITGLFTSGSLTQKVFLQTIQKTDFVQLFGTKSIDTLARTLAYIGPTGRDIQRTIRSFQSPQGRQMFEFLDKNGLIETHHGGGEVVYLRRG